MSYSVKLQFLGIVQRSKFVGSIFTNLRSVEQKEKADTNTLFGLSV